MKKNGWKSFLTFLLVCILAAESTVGNIQVQAAAATEAELVYIASQESESAEENQEISDGIEITAASDSAEDGEDTMDLSESMIITYAAGPSYSHSPYSEAEQIAYAEAQLVATWDSFTEECTFSFQYRITQSILQTAINNLLYENYQYFYISSTCSLTYHMDTSYITAVTFTYTMTESEAEVGLVELEEAIEEYTDTVDSEWSELELALYLNDLLARICEYDTSYEYFSAYDVLVRGTAVCQGYALAYRILAEELGLSCELVSSTYLNHIWNVVQINGTWYHVDVTWDDPTTDLLGKAAHNYFLKSSSYFASSSGGHAASDWSFTGNVTSSDASDTTYDSYFWDSITTGFEYIDGLWYAISGTSLNSYSCDGSSFTKTAAILTVSDTWYKWGKTTGYSGSYVSLASYNGVLYYSTSTKIYSYKPSTSTTSTTYTLSSPYSTLGYIYGIRVTLNGELQFYLATSPSSSGKVGIYTAKQLNSSVANLVKATITLSSTSYTYSGSAKKPTVTVKYGTKTLTKGTDYTVTYSDNTAIGTALVTIVGIGNYTGTVIKTFTIKLGSCKISALTNTSSGIKVTWGRVTGATGYYIYRKVSGGSYSLIKTITSGSTVSYTDTTVKSKNGTKYYYYVKAYYKDSSGTITKGSRANTKLMVRLTGVSVSSLTNSSSKKLTVKWSRNSKATGYQIQYSTSSSFSSYKTVTVSGSSTVSKVISSLTKGKTYYVRVRVYKTVSGTKYYSAWSSKKSIKIST